MNNIYILKNASFAYQYSAIVRQDITDILEGYTFKEVVQVYSSQLASDNVTIPCFQDGNFPFDSEDHFDFDHYCRAEEEFKKQYMKDYVIPKFTEKKNVTDCILDTYWAYGVCLPYIGNELVNLKKELKASHGQEGKSSD